MPEEESNAGKLFSIAADYIIKYKLLDKLRKFILNEKSVVLLCGSSGVGKSQFVESLQKPLSNSISAQHRTRGWHRVGISLGKRKFELLDTPGQIGDKPSRDAAHRAAYKEKRYGIINVVANGYHEGIASQAQALTIARKQVSVNPSFLQSSFELEISSLKEWTSTMIEPSWVITLVNKADLWWTPDNFESVVSQYRDAGPYSDCLSEWKSKHIVVPYSSVNKPFYDRVPMTGLFSDSVRLDYQIAFLRALESLVLEHKKK